MMTGRPARSVPETKLSQCAGDPVPHHSTMSSDQSGQHLGGRGLPYYGQDQTGGQRQDCLEGWHTAARNSMIPPTPLLQHPILMRISLIAMQTLKTFSPLTASYSIALSRKSSDPNALTKPNFFTADLDAEIAHCYAIPQDNLAADRQLRNRPTSKVLESKRAHKTKFLRGIRRAHIIAFLESASNGSILLYATSLTRQFPLLHSLILTFVFHKLYS